MTFTGDGKYRKYVLLKLNKRDSGDMFPGPKIRQIEMV